ncbi:V-set domain-containing T-cell activation inhibitor 1-like [Danio rerio]|uniref:V-set domain-containing T-cell activation inhibitor 1-like n=2 Tax=Danio rerio TaxID=7955 RepID=A0AB32TD12_DANRE
MYKDQFLPLFHKLSLQESIVGFIGDSSVIECSTRQPELTVQDIIMCWRHNNLNVYDIINGQVSVEGQNQEYKNRAETFPDEYKNGNFSLKLNNLQHSDKGRYTCYIIRQSILKSFNLIVKEKQVRESTNQGTKPRPKRTAIMFANSATGVYLKFHVPVPSPNKMRSGYSRT